MARRFGAASILRARYCHSGAVHNLVAPREIVPIICEVLRPESVVDVGAGIGTFLRVFKEYGVKRCLGIDGPWVDRTKLVENIPANEFMQADLEQPLNYSGEPFDLALCLEVAEHLPVAAGPVLVESLTSISEVILFSAAVPGQGGMNHINEQWPEYWADLFATRGFITHDVIRPIFYENPKINWWYRQNLLLVTSMQKAALGELFRPYALPRPLRMVDPDNFSEKSRELEEVNTGRKPLLYYAKILAKAVRWKMAMFRGRE